MNSTNILIFTEIESEFFEIKSVLKTILGRDLFTIYRIGSSDLNSPWIKNCNLLVNLKHNQDSSELFLDYLKRGGKILSIPSSSLNKVKKNLLGVEVNVYENQDLLCNDNKSVSYLDWSASLIFSTGENFHYTSKVFFSIEFTNAQVLTKSIVKKGFFGKY